jgi:hypothetical protein
MNFARKIPRIALSVLGLAIATWAQGPLHLKCTLSDPVFQSKDSLQASILETGETVSVTYGKPFSAKLPQDTLWNLCFNAPALEKCYAIKYLGKDSTFSLVVSGDDLVTWFSDSTMETTASLPDSSADSASIMDTVDLASLLASGTEKTQLKKVVVQLRRKPKRRMGESVVSAKRIKRMPGLAEADVIRSIQALPGVVASSDFSTKIYVRGGGADQNLFLLDNAVVYSPVHFFGLFSTFLVEAVDEVKFYKSGFAPLYGNRLSSVVDIRSRAGGTDSTEAWFDKSSVKISTFATQIHTEGKQYDTRWLFAGRATYIKQILDLLNATKVIDFKLNYRFTDLQGSVVHDFDEGRSLGLSFYSGSDILDFDPIALDWGNTVIPLNFRWKLDDTWNYSATASYSKFSQSFGLRDIFGIYNAISTVALKQSITNRDGIAEDHEVTAGYDVEYDKVNFTQNVEIADSKYVDTTKVLMHSLYLQDTWRTGPWEILFGARANYQDLAQHFGIEPRLSGQYRFGDYNVFNAHLGYYLQYLNSIMFSDQETLNEFYYPSRKATSRTIMPTGSLLTTFGYTRERLFDVWNFNTECYYKTQNHLVVYDVNAQTDASRPMNSIADLFKEGSGYSFGYEASLRKNEGIVSGGLSWSQGWSVLKEQWDTVPYYPDWHQPYAFKGDIAINWSGNDGIFAKNNPKYWRSSISLKYASGLPYTEYAGYQYTSDINQSLNGGAGGPGPEFQDGIAVRLGNRNTSLQSPYFRIDAKVIDVGREGTWNFSWTILNLLDHDNVFLYNYDTSKNPPQENTIYQFPFFPVLLNYEYYF